MANPQNELEALRAQVAALTARVYQLELARDPSSGVAPPAIAPSIPRTVSIPPVTTAPVSDSPRVNDTLPPPPIVPPLQQPNFQLHPVAASAKAADGDLEKKIGQYWLNRIGIAAMLIGVSYFIKYAFENNWIGPGGRIAIGLIAGIALVLWSERFRAAGHVAFSYSLKAVGIGALYLSLWGAFQVYHLIPPAAAFLAMTMVTAATIVMALSECRNPRQLCDDWWLRHAHITFHRSGPRSRAVFLRRSSRLRHFGDGHCETVAPPAMGHFRRNHHSLCRMVLQLLPQLLHDRAARHRACVPEGRMLFPSLNVEENLLMGALGQRPGYWNLQRIFALFPLLAERRRQMPNTLSGGQQGLVAIGRALMANPDLLLCDEISLGLAPVAVDQIYASFARIRVEGAAIVVVEQDVKRAASATDRIYCLLRDASRCRGEAESSMPRTHPRLLRHLRRAL